MKNIRSEIAKYALELFVVGFGVFLGIFVSEWRAQKSTDAKVHNSLQYIQAELQSSEQKLEEAIAYHQAIKESLTGMTQTLSEAEIMEPYFLSTKFRHNKIEGWQGLGLRNYENISFQSAKTNGTFQELDIEMIQEISKQYRQLESNMDFGKSIADRLTNMNSETKTIDVIGTLELLVYDFLESEKHISTNLDKTLSKLNAHLEK